MKVRPAKNATQIIFLVTFSAIDVEASYFMVVYLHFVLDLGRPQERLTRLVKTLSSYGHPSDWIVLSILQ
jgi:hypothetical protein